MEPNNSVGQARENQPLFKQRRGKKPKFARIFDLLLTLLSFVLFVFLAACIVVIIVFAISKFLFFHLSSIELYGPPLHYKFGEKITLPIPEPVLPPSPAILLSVRGNSTHPDDIMCAWTSILEWNPAVVAIVLTSHVVAYDFVVGHGTFALNLVPSEYTVDFDRIDLANTESRNKFHPFSRFTSTNATSINAPMIKQSLVQLECNVTKIVELPRDRFVFIADVLQSHIDEKIFDPSPSNGDQENSIKLRTRNAPFFALASGSGTFYEMGKEVGHVFMSRDEM